jgi:phosphoglycolate phosphatase-like HAD superfamily hydrolase
VTPHIVWDWNGTLFDDWDAVYRASCELFAARGLPAVTAEQYRAAYTRPITAFYARLFGRELEPSEFAGMDREFHAAYERAMPRVTLAGDAREALRAWRAAGGSQSLLSMFRHERLLELVRRFELEPEFVRVDGLTGPGGGRKAEHLDRHLRRLRLDPAGVTLVGDSLDDAAAAEDAGARCVLYDGGSHPRETLAATGLPVAGTLAEALSWAA